MSKNVLLSEELLVKLMSKFYPETAEAVVSVALATQNPNNALLKVIGEFKSPDIPLYVRDKFEDVLMFISYDSLAKEEVTYKICKRKLVEVYSSEPLDITEDLIHNLIGLDLEEQQFWFDGKSFTCFPVILDFPKHHYQATLPIGEFEHSEPKTIELSTWLTYEVVSE